MSTQGEGRRRRREKSGTCWQRQEGHKEHRTGCAFLPLRRAADKTGSISMCPHPGPGKGNRWTGVFTQALSIQIISHHRVQAKQVSDERNMENNNLKKHL